MNVCHSLFALVLMVSVYVPQVLAVERLRTFGDLPGRVSSIAFSENGDQLAIAAGSDVVIVEIRRMEIARVISPKFGKIGAVQFGEGSQVFVGGYQKLALFQASTGEKVRDIGGIRGYVTSLKVSKDGKWLAIASDDEKLRVCPTTSSDGLRVVGKHQYPVNGVDWSPNGQWLATASGDETRVTKPGEVRIFRTTDFEQVHLMTDHIKSATAVAFSPDSATLASAGVDEKVILWDTASANPLGMFDGHGRPVNAVLFHPSGESLVSGSGGGFAGKQSVLWWDRDGTVRETLVDHQKRISSLAICPSRELLATGGYDQAVCLYSLRPKTKEPSPVDASAPANVLAGDIKHHLVAVTTNAEPSFPLAMLQNDPSAKTQAQQNEKVMRIGIIGLDTSHATAFTKIFNSKPQSDNEKAQADDVKGFRVVAAYPKGSPDIADSVKRVPAYTKEVVDQGVEIVSSIPELLTKVDCVLLETNDGRPHLEQVLPVLKAGKRCFVDKPVAGTLADAIAIYSASEKYKVPIFSSSSLRFTPGAQEIRAGKIGDVIGCDAYSPCSLEATHPDLFWYGIHGVESLFTVMGTGCESVTRTTTKDVDLVVGVWNGGRVGTFRGQRSGARGYGGTAFGTKTTQQIGNFAGYRPLLVEIVKYFRTGQVPVTPAETLEIYAFMEAADESKRQGGVPIKMEDVMAKAKVAAAARLKELDGK